jgi:small subunit ribosomal protein S1
MPATRDGAIDHWLNGVKDADETDVDCGGVAAPTCLSGRLRRSARSALLRRPRSPQTGRRRTASLRTAQQQKIWLSRRSTVDDPWAAVATKYAAGTKHTGKVARLKPFGAFIELEPGVDGLIQVGDLSVKRIEHPNEVLKEGDTMDVVVAYVEPGSHRIALHPAPTGAAANETPQKIAPQRTVRVQIVSTEAAGLTVRILGATGRHARGFITAGATGTPRGSDLRKEFPVGKELDAKIVEIDPKRGELKLSSRAMNEDTERNAYQQYRAQVKREAKFGTLADLLQKRNIVPQK